MATSQPARRRTSASADRQRFTRISIPLRQEDVARLSAFAALAGVDRGAAAASMIVAGLKGILVVDRRKSSGQVVPDAQVNESADDE